jgi:N-acetylglucosamine-6-phosphate deacetylase
VIVERDPDAAPESKATTIRARRGDKKYTLDQTTAEAGPAGGGAKPGEAKGWVRYRLVSAPVPPVDTPAQVVFVTMHLDDPTKAFISTNEQTPEQFKLAKEVKTPETDELASIPADLPVPFEAYGRMGKAGSDRLPPQENLALVNATIWTCNAKNEVIEEGAVLIEGGKIRYVGPMGKMPALPEGAKKQDLRGMHLTPGLIDAHSHTGISKGVNEGGQAVTAEVRIGDVTDPDSVSWYRQLAGGVTCVNSMHGSANPIGGQTQTNKVRWGVTHPDQMHMEGAKPGIKFALGENVKQSNWGPQFNTRYPQSRMGVEAIIRDRFVAAREYMEAAKRHRDLELDALTEILRGERLIHCHSYRQDEILMLCRVADEFGFKIGTFQHGLECYKVAREVKEHAIGASIFTDWWAYKMEVQDAIPYDGPILHDQGVVVSFNSDSDELARRLKDEAIKASKYSGGQPRANEGDLSTDAPRIDAGEALRFVTINPATQLGIGDRVGSIEVGKDADLAVWSLSPASTYSRCEMTYVDGRRLFSRDEDGEARMRIEHERARLIQKILGQEAREKGSPLGEGKEQAGGKPDARPSGDDAADAPTRPSLMLQMREQAADLRRERYLSLIRRGLDPRFARCADCGEIYEGSR